MIVANQIGVEDSGFGSDYNKATIISQDFEIKLPKMTKTKLADKIIEQIILLRKKTIPSALFCAHMKNVNHLF